MSEFYSGDWVAFEVPGERRTADGIVTEVIAGEPERLTIKASGQVYSRAAGECQYLMHALCRPCGDAWDDAFHQPRTGDAGEWRKKLNDDCAAITLNCRRNHPKVVNL